MTQPVVARDEWVESLTDEDLHYACERAEREMLAAKRKAEPAFDHWSRLVDEKRRRRDAALLLGSKAERPQQGKTTSRPCARTSRGLQR